MSAKHKRKQIKAQKARKKNWKLLFLFAGLALFIAGITIAGMARDTAFEKAVKNPVLREGYVQEIVAKSNKPESLVQINYIDTEEGLELVPTDTYMQIASLDKETHVLDWGKKEFFFQLNVYPLVFASGSPIKNDQDFLSMLMHEFRHIQVMESGEIGQFKVSNFYMPEKRSNYDLFSSIMELEAFRAQLLHKSKISDTYWQFVRSRYLSYYADLWKFEEGLPSSLILDLKAFFFEPVSLNLSVVQLESMAKIGKNARMVNNKTGEIIEIPPEIYKRKLEKA